MSIHQEHPTTIEWSSSKLTFENNPSLEAANTQLFYSKNYSKHAKRRAVLSFNIRKMRIELTLERLLLIILLTVFLLALLVIAIISILSYVSIFFYKQKLYKESGQAIGNMTMFTTLYEIVSNSSLNILEPTYSKEFLKQMNASMQGVIVNCFGVRVLLGPFVERPAFITSQRLLEISEVSGRILTSYQPLYKNYKVLYEYVFKVESNTTSRASKVETFRKYYETCILSNFVTISEMLNETMLIVDEESDREDILMQAIGIPCCVLAGFTLLIIISNSLFVVYKTLDENNKLLKAIQIVNSQDVLETIRDGSNVAVNFKKYCKEQFKLKYFLFLERTIAYMEICNEIYEKHENENIQDDSNLLEEEISKLESRKCELTFEILTEFLGHKGEYFLGNSQIGGKKLIEKVRRNFNDNPMNLPENLFSKIESNIAVQLISTFKSFKTLQNSKRDQFFDIHLKNIPIQHNTINY